MWPQEFTWFFALFHQEFRKGNLIAFEVLMTLAFAHFFGFYNPKQLADFLDVPGSVPIRGDGIQHTKSA